MNQGIGFGYHGRHDTEPEPPQPAAARRLDVGGDGRGRRVGGVAGRAGRRPGDVPLRGRGPDAGPHGVRALAVETGHGPAVYLICRPSTRYYRVMTRCQFQPVLIGEVI